MLFRYFPIMITCMFLVGCGGSGARASQPDSPALLPDGRPIARTMVYDCNGYDFIARLGPGEMAIWLPDRYVVLSHVRSASGTKYQEGDVEFWSRGDDAMLVVGDQQYLNCTLQPHRVPWEDARRRGVDFRAVGNEPGWSLEIRDGDHLLFVGDYGMQRVSTPDPGQQSLGEAKSWHAITESADLQVEVIDKVCLDTMSGEEFPSQVTVTLDGEVYRGCGRALDYPWEQ